MSKGTRITPLRIPPDLLALIDAAIETANERRVEEEYNRTSWIIAAIRDRLGHLARGRRQSHKKKSA